MSGPADGPSPRRDGGTGHVGLLGLGAMGSAAAAVLLGAGYRVTAWNRGPDPVRAAVALGARAAPTPAGVAVADVVLTALLDDDALDAVLAGPDGALAAMRPGTLHVSTDSISPATARRLAAEHAAAGRAFVAAPVFGRPDELGTPGAVFAVSGAPEAVALALPVLTRLGSPRVVGEGPDQAHLVKVTGNFLIMSAVQALAEALAVLSRAGVDPEQLRRIVVDKLFPGRLHDKYAGMIIADRYPADARLSLAAKDNRLLLDAAEELGVPLPTASLLRDRLLAARANAPDGEEEDWSCIARRAYADAAALGERR